LIHVMIDEITALIEGIDVMTAEINIATGMIDGRIDGAMVLTGVLMVVMAIMAPQDGGSHGIITKATLIFIIMNIIFLLLPMSMKILRQKKYHLSSNRLPA